MDASKFKTLLEDHLLPFLPGAEAKESLASTPRQGLVSYRGQCTLLVKPTKPTKFRIKIRRSQPFSPDEKKLIEFFCKEIGKISIFPENSYFEDIMTAVPRQIIARYLYPHPMGQNTLHKAIRQFESLASQTYEGHPVVVAIGMTGSTSLGLISLDELWKEDFSAVLSNGFDTMYASGKDGKVFNLYHFPKRENIHSFTPFRFGVIAKWCRKDEPNRVALVLNRNGEILIFKGERIEFAKRRGEWRYYPHDSTVKRIGKGIGLNLKNCIYQSCLDVSFARTGGCLALIRQKHIKKVDELVSENDIIKHKKITKTKFLYKAIKKKPFHKLERPIRQELLSMDGATIINKDGTILAAGAIINVPSGSEGGGRRAAAVKLSKYGIGIKVSSDGPVTGFEKGDETFRF